MTQPFLQTIDDLRHTVKVNASFKFEILEPYLQDTFDRYIVPYLGEALVDRLYREPLTQDTRQPDTGTIGRGDSQSGARGLDR